MPNYYFDIETTGLDPLTSQIITIQFQPLDRNTALPVGELVVLKSWESSEKQILQEFIARSGVAGSNAWSFIPMGYNLGFEHSFLRERCRVHGLPPIDVLNKPFVDLRPFGVIMNRGEFKGSGLDKITGKPRNGQIIPEWFAAKQYDLIIDYVTVEAREYVKLCAWLYKEMPQVLEKYKKENGL